MKKLFTIVLFCFSGGVLSQELINLECRMENVIDSPTFFRLFQDKDDVRRPVDLPVERITWSPTMVTISSEIERPSGATRRMRSQRAWPHLDKTGWGRHQTGDALGDLGDFRQWS